MTAARQPALSAVLLALAVTMLPWGAHAKEVNPWKQWFALLHHACPRNHVDWTCDGSWMDLIGAFEETLDTADQERIAHFRDYRRCESEVMGFSCEMAVSLEAYQQTKLMRRFVAFGCQAVKCEEPALCSRFPGQDR
ncbi:MAG TPA: hypothetical protein VKT70_00365 [Stellaceae bacterium]|nr:hypothetical protein [Stellaceae bacterium]